MKRSRHLLLLAVLAVLVALLSTPTSPASAADPQPAVSITSDKATYVAGQTAKLVFNVSGAGSGTTLRIVTTWANGRSAEQQTSVTDGPQRFTLAMYLRTRVRAYIGGATEPSDSKVFGVKAVVSTRPRGGYLGFSGSYTVFPTGSSPIFRSTTFPKRPGVRCLVHEVQRLYASGWGTVLRSSCRVQASDGFVDWKWAGTHGSGAKFRARAMFSGDSWNLAANAPWSYFKFN